MKMIAGALFFASSNSSRTRAAPTPTNISMNSDPLIEKNGTPDSPATARASSVLPVPGGPTSSTPRGTLPPSRRKRSGSFRNCTISCRSRLAAVRPATSSNVTSSALACRIGGSCFFDELAERPARHHRALARAATPTTRRR